MVQICRLQNKEHKSMKQVYGKICRKFWDKLVKILQNFYEKFNEIFEKSAENIG